MSKIGDLLRYKRLEKKLTLQEVADHIGCSKMTISKYENGRVENIGKDKIVALSNLLDINPIQFIDGLDMDLAIAGSEISLKRFKTYLNYLLTITPEIDNKQKQLIKDYINMILYSKGE